VNNLQKKHVNLSRSLIKESLNPRDRQQVTKLLSDKAFFEYFRKRLIVYEDVKSDHRLTPLITSIVNCKSVIETSNMLIDAKGSSKKLLGVLIHSHILYKSGNIPAVMDRQKYLKDKEEVLSDFVKRVKSSEYRIALSVWGSYLMRNKKFNVFSDVDLILIIDDKRLSSNARFNIFMRSLFQEITDYNLPTLREVGWLINNKGIARCGFIKNGVFVNLKIITREALLSCCDVFSETLKERTHGFQIIPSFKSGKLRILRKNQISVYPFVKNEGGFVVGRGLLAEFINTNRVIAYSEARLKQELQNICKIGIKKGMIIKSFYRSNQDSPEKGLLALTHSPSSEICKDVIGELLELYVSILKTEDVRMPYSYVKIYCEVILPLLEECPEKTWNNENLLSFFTGAPIRKRPAPANLGKAIKNYHRNLDSFQKNILQSHLAEDIDLILDSIKGKRFEGILKSIQGKIGYKKAVLLFSAFVDLCELNTKERSDYYDIAESTFSLLFPSEFHRADTTLQKLTERVNKDEKLKLFQKTLKSNLVGQSGIFEIRYRIRRSEGLFHHHLMKQVPMHTIDDIISFQISYVSKDNFNNICSLVERALTQELDCKIQRNELRLENYRGTHFYFLINKVPVEVMIRDLDSDTTIEHKIEHSVTQKREQRLSCI
jgi:hypothetical protein